MTWLCICAFIEQSVPVTIHSCSVGLFSSVFVYGDGVTGDVS
jgi:hypothetical protein